MKPLPKLDLNTVLAGHAIFADDFPVSAKSLFSHECWDYVAEKSARQNSVPDARLRIHWGNYARGENEDAAGENLLLPPLIIHELQIFTVLYHRIPEVFTGTASRELKAQTVVVTIRALARCLSAIYRNSLLGGQTNGEPLSHIENLSDISLRELRRTLEESPYADGELLKRGLGYLATPVFQKYLQGGSLQWNKKDLETLDFCYTKARDDYNPVMPNDLFRFLSNTACSDVIGFLRLLGIQPEDKTSIAQSAACALAVSNGRKMFDDYVQIRAHDREHRAKVGKKQFASKTERKYFQLNHLVTLQETLDYLYRVQRAAYTVIGLYTGARYSDLTSFKTGCIVKHHGIYVLAGTLAKFEEDSKLEDNDLWPAIPIMRDALRCLEEISRVTFNPYLISGRETVAIGNTPKPLTLTGLTSAINNYLTEIDTSGNWQHWRIHPHQLRHTLAHQLARADVGLMFIAHQMKHLHSALTALPPAVTLTYGNIGDLKTQRAIQAKPAYTEAAAELYDPTKPIAGGGAEDFKNRRKAYFEGMAAQGWTKDEIIEHLARQGLPFASVGMGYCGGKRDTLLKDGTRELNPCLGSLQCNPNECHQAVITRTHISQWKKVLKQNLDMAADDRMSHAREVHLAAAQEARTVLAQLEVEIA